MTRKRWIVVALVVLLEAPALAYAGTSDTGHWKPYEFLVGEWDLAPQSGGAPVAILRFRWGPNRSYLWYAASLLVDGTERPHFEGLLLWNGQRRNLDMLLSVDLERGLVQEQGVVFAEPDGTVIRDITAVYSEGEQPIGKPAAGPAGATARFRQTFKREGPDRVFTSVLRQTEKSWTATFPGSDRLVMTRRTPA